MVFRSTCYFPMKEKYVLVQHDKLIRTEIFFIFLLQVIYEIMKIVTQITECLVQ
jgi:hypothetical protein